MSNFIINSYNLQPTVAVDSFQDFDSASVPESLSETIMDASMKGTGSWDGLGTGSGFDMFDVVSHAAVAFARPILVNGVKYANSGTKWIECDYTAHGAGGGYWNLRFFPPGALEEKEHILVEGFIDMGITGSDEQNNFDIVQVNSPAGYLVSQLAVSDTSRTIGMHSQGGSGGGLFSVGLTRKIFFFQVWYDTVGTRMTRIRYFDPSDNYLLVGDITGEPAAGTGITNVIVNANYLNLGDANSTNLFGGLCFTYDSVAALRDPAPLVGAPGTITLTPLTSTSFSLSFSGVGGATSYRYDVATDSGFTSLVVTNTAVANPGSPAATITGLTASTTYYVRARAINDQETSANSATQSVTTSAASSIAWASNVVGGGSFNAPVGERGLKITVGASNVEVTHLGLWGVTGQYADAFIRIRDSGLNIVASVTVPVAGLTVGAYNYVQLGANYTMTAGGTYYITRDVAGYNEYWANGTQSVDTAVATIVYPCDEAGNDTSLGRNGGINFKYLA